MSRTEATVVAYFEPGRRSVSRHELPDVDISRTATNSTSSLEVGQERLFPGLASGCPLGIAELVASSLPVRIYALPSTECKIPRLADELEGEDGIRVIIEMRKDHASDLERKIVERSRLRDMGCGDGLILEI